jgi:hypothetical protein
MTGIGTVLGEFLAATGGNLSALESADQLAGLAPTPRDSGPTLRKPGPTQALQPATAASLLTSALISIQRSPASSAYCDRKRA